MTCALSKMGKYTSGFGPMIMVRISFLWVTRFFAPFRAECTFPQKQVIQSMVVDFLSFELQLSNGSSALLGAVNRLSLSRRLNSLSRDSKSLKSRIFFVVELFVLHTTRGNIAAWAKILQQHLKSTGLSGKGFQRNLKRVNDSNLSQNAKATFLQQTFRTFVS